ncbi:MAG TPA: MYXO-CTERM sorting domain-containing protein, partial [Polyangia bacterium]|nr:MYXO-CTERM sorting domain-containing protein [Polyangia bacterium]
TTGGGTGVAGAGTTTGGAGAAGHVGAATGGAGCACALATGDHNIPAWLSLLSLGLFVARRRARR